MNCFGGCCDSGNVHLREFVDLRENKEKEQKRKKSFCLELKSVMNACAVRDNANGMLLQGRFTLHFVGRGFQ